MHLRVVDCNPHAPKTFKTPNLKVEYCNNALPAGLRLDVLVWARFNPPILDEPLIHDDFHLVDLARSFYEELPEGVRCVKPFDGTFKVIKSGHTGTSGFPRRYVDLAMMRKIECYRVEDEFFKAVAMVLGAREVFSAPWDTALWTVQWGTYINFQPGKDLPIWLMKYCTKEHIRLDVATTWPVEAYV